MKKLQLIRNILLVLTTIWSIFIIAAIILTYLDGYPLIWLDYFGTICLVIVPLFIAYYSPILIKTFIIDIHQSNLQSIKVKTLD